ncbi:hypothetical protein Plo01_46280 [Planobispora longispora]|uniref:Uncharacterized protein n=1 Tax=Planobispora longispora TaxID=28887 RepID=A0A8J3W672_9ACTN|nr:hypothetical protein GCM10020093_020710 [Planobispora longispora]GIH78199.1 hypothetical protein Plo01_46280 [Planobispora longispora]
MQGIDPRATGVASLVATDQQIGAALGRADLRIVGAPTAKVTAAEVRLSGAATARCSAPWPTAARASSTLSVVPAS